jgi:hypothetical protein
MAKKRKLNSKNPKYWPKEKTEEPTYKERRQINTHKGTVKVWSVFL